MICLIVLGHAILYGIVLDFKVEETAYSQEFGTLSHKCIGNAVCKRCYQAVQSKAKRKLCRMQNH